jgi:hypothetical protein
MRLVESHNSASNRSWIVPRVSVFWHEAARIFGLQRQFDFLPEEEAGIRDAIAHFDEVFQSHVRDRVRIVLASALEFLEELRPVWAVLIEQLEKYRAIFERAIHSLPEERDDGVSGVAE